MVGKKDDFLTLEEALCCNDDLTIEERAIKLKDYIDTQIRIGIIDEIQRVCEACNIKQQYEYKDNVLSIVKISIVGTFIVMLILPVILYLMGLNDGIIWRIELGGFVLIALIVGVGLLQIKPKELGAAVALAKGINLNDTRSKKK